MQYKEHHTSHQRYVVPSHRHHDETTPLLKITINSLSLQLLIASIVARFDGILEILPFRGMLYQPPQILKPQSTSRPPKHRMPEYQEFGELRAARDCIPVPQDIGILKMFLHHA